MRVAHGELSHGLYHKPKLEWGVHIQATQFRFTILAYRGGLREMNCSFQLVCPDCRTTLFENTVCESCGKTYAWLKEAKLVSFKVDLDRFYQEFYEGMGGRSRDPRLPLRDRLLSLRERPSLSARRERFFRNYLSGTNDIVILDVACGYGRKLFKEYGKVIGLDIVLEPLYGTSEIYDLCVHADAFATPFPNEYFDYVVSSDFLGHIPLEQKDDLYHEFRRILKPDGKMLHVMETDANNWHFRFAHRYPELFQKYFIVAIGGHFGLELPSKAIRRLEANGFKVLEARKIWGDLWQVQEYQFMFDNEYKELSKLIKIIVALSKVLSSNIVVQEALNVVFKPGIGCGRAYYAIG